MAFELSSTILLGIRAVQALFAIIVLGTMGYVSSWWNSNWRTSAPSEVGFLIFAAVWTLLVVAFLVIVPMRFGGTMLGHRFAILAAEAITMIFWFAGFIAAAVWLTGRVCVGSVCRTATAGTVFAAFEWLLFAITAAFATLHLFHSRSTTVTKVHSTGPSMTVQEGVYVVDDTRAFSGNCPLA